MKPLNGFEDLQPRKVLGVTPEGRLMVAVSDGVREFDMFIKCDGGIQVRPVAIPEKTTVDQEISSKPPERVPVRERWRGIDQAEGVLKTA